MRFLIERASSNLNFYLQVLSADKICWCIDAWGAPGKKPSKILRATVDNFLDECENRMVNVSNSTVDFDCNGG
jgi:hypothetical protein